MAVEQTVNMKPAIGVSNTAKATPTTVEIAEERLRKLGKSRLAKSELP